MRPSILDLQQQTSGCIRRDLVFLALKTAGLLVGLSSTLLPATAQMAEVPSPNNQGDFITAVLRGNRGNYYPNRIWLVVDPDPQYLNCRDRPNGSVRSRIAPGAAITAEFINGEAIVFQDGSPWLRIRGTDPLTIPLQGATLGTCYVRANTQYIAPVNQESIQGGVFGPI